jgi:hypothetical protein
VRCQALGQVDDFETPRTGNHEDQNISPNLMAIGHLTSIDYHRSSAPRIMKASGWPTSCAICNEVLDLYLMDLHIMLVASGAFGNEIPSHGRTKCEQSELSGRICVYEKPGLVTGNENNRPE